jgi:hypothetical protein
MLCFGDRVAILNNFFYQTRGSTLLQTQLLGMLAKCCPKWKSDAEKVTTLFADSTP